MPQHLGRNHAKMYTKYERILFFKAQNTVIKIRTLEIQFNLFILKSKEFRSWVLGAVTMPLYTQVRITTEVLSLMLNTSRKISKKDNNNSFLTRQEWQKLMVNEGFKKTKQRQNYRNRLLRSTLLSKGRKHEIISDNCF